MSHVDFLIKKYDLKNLRIMDDTFTLNKKRVLGFCDLMEERGYRLNMTCLTYAKCADYEVFERMKEVGFSIIAFGVECGNEDVLKIINKGITKNDVRNAVYLAKKAGLSTELLFMIGNIRETKETIMDSINFAKEINPPSSNITKNAIWNWFQFATPTLGSLFFNTAKHYGKVLTYDWSRYHHQEPIFIPEGLDRKTLIKLRDYAFKETNAFRFSWVPTLIRKNTVAQKLYNCIKSAL